MAKDKQYYDLKYKDENHLHNIHEYGIDYLANEIYLVGNPEYIGVEEGEGGVEYSMASTFIKNLNILMRKSNHPILIHMKTCGGYWEEGMAIYDAIKTCPNQVTILNYTHARSMSSLIFSAADKRVMMPNSTFMFHEGTFSTHGTTKVARTEFAELERTGDVMLDIYVRVLKAKGTMSKKPMKAIRAWLVEQMDKKEDVFLTAKESVKIGFADSIFDGSQWVDELTKYDD